MSDSNNQNQDDTSTAFSQNLNSRASSFGPNSNDMGYGNQFSQYNRSSSYGMNDSYGGYSSGYGGYGGSGSYGSGGYGGYSSYGGYGGYNRGYSSYGGQNQYSNQYSKPIPPNQQNEQIPPPNLRQDMWGFLNGFHAMLNVLYAATGIVHFGKIFMKMSVKIIKMICGKSIGLVWKLTGFKFLKKILVSLSATDNWTSEFNVSEQPFENVWGNGASVNNSTIFGKILLVLRVCSLLGTGLALFLRSKMNHQHPPPVDTEVLGPDVQPQPTDIPQNLTDFERVKSFYDDIKLIEDDNQVKFNEVQEQQEVETFVHVLEEGEKSLELAPENEPLKALDDSASDISAKLAECQALLEKELEQDKEFAEKAKETVEAVVETVNIEEITAPVVKNFEKSFSTPIFDKQTESSQFDITSASTKESIPSTPQESIVSEDFWKNPETFKSIENLQKEAKKPEETEKKEFELPSVLQTLRSNSMPSTKPWLMKKKKTVEIPVETPQQAQTVQENTLEKVPEVNEICEPKLEQVIEVPEILETPQGKLETPLESLEGTTV